MREKIMHIMRILGNILLILAIIAAIIACGLLIFVLPFYFSDVEVEREVEISTLMDSPTVNTYGDLLYVRSDPSIGYFFYVEESDGSYKAYSISSKNTNIHLVEGDHRIVIHATVPRILENISFAGLTHRSDDFRDFHCDIYVPPGTIKESYRLDAE